MIKKHKSTPEALDGELFQPLSDEEARLVVVGTGRVLTTYDSNGNNLGQEFVLDSNN